jgi:hypothetical protein
MNAGYSPSTWMRNRGTLMNAGYSPSTWMRNRGTLTPANPERFTALGYLTPQQAEESMTR